MRALGGFKILMRFLTRAVNYNEAMPDTFKSEKKESSVVKRQPTTFF